MVNGRKISLYLVTGFLGAGKTTLLKNLLESRETGDTGVLVNEFGKVSIDGKILKRDGMKLIEINNGSIFCSCLEGSFTEALIAFANSSINCLFVESSGLADPSSMVRLLSDIEGKTQGIFDYRGAVCVVDAQFFLQLLDTVEAVLHQVAHSSAIVINKTDLVDGGRIGEIENKIRDINPKAAILKTSYGRLDQRFLEGLRRDSQLYDSDKSVNCPTNAPQALLLRSKGIFSLDKFEGFLNGFVANTYRIKGFVHCEDGWYKVDGVGDDIHCTPAEHGHSTSYLVIISKSSRSLTPIVRKEWKEWFQQEFVLYDSKTKGRFSIKNTATPVYKVNC